MCAQSRMLRNMPVIKITRRNAAVYRNKVESRVSVWPDMSVLRVKHPMLTPFTWTEMFTEDECVEIVRLANAEGFREAGLVRGRQNSSIRPAKIAWLDETGEASWVFDRVFGTVISANRQHFGFKLDEFAERIQVALYDVDNGGWFDWHVDIGSGSFASKRNITLVAQLTDRSGYSGGALAINATGVAETASDLRGDGVLFPSFLPHRVSKMEAGVRYSLTTWAHGPAFQ